jgi:hypothetical protein
MKTGNRLQEDMLVRVLLRLLLFVASLISHAILLAFSLRRGSRDSTVGIATGYGLDDRGLS